MRIKDVERRITKIINDYETRSQVKITEVYVTRTERKPGFIRDISESLKVKVYEED